MAQKLHKRLILLLTTVFLTILLHVLLLDTLPGNPESWFYTHRPEFSFSYQPTRDFPSIMVNFWQILQGNLGESYVFQKPVGLLLKSHLPVSFLLTSVCLLCLYPLAILLAIGLDKDYPLSLPLYRGFMALSAIPSCLIYACLAVFSFHSSFMMRSYPLAVAFLVCRRVAQLTSLIRKHLHQERKKRYVIFAYQRKVPKKIIWKNYILKNALRPIFIRLPKHFVYVLFSGTLMAEMLFSIEGFGRLSFLALKSHDYPLILGCLLISSFCISLSYIASDYLSQRL